MKLSTFLTILCCGAAPLLATAMNDKAQESGSDSAKSIDMSVPGNLSTEEINENWLDSVPYLIENARFGKKWAYEALGDCYRFGLGGVEKSVFNAMTFYEFAGVDIEVLVDRMAVENPTDPFLLVYRLVEAHWSGDRQGMTDVLDSMQKVGYHEADFFNGRITADGTVVLPDSLIINNLTGDGSIDNAFLTMMVCGSEILQGDRFEDEEQLEAKITEKIPFINNLYGQKYYTEFSENIGAPRSLMQKAAKCFETADKYGLLERRNASILYRFYQGEMGIGRMKRDQAILKRMADLSGIINHPE